MILLHIVVLLMPSFFVFVFSFFFFSNLISNVKIVSDTLLICTHFDFGRPCMEIPNYHSSRHLKSESNLIKWFCLQTRKGFKEAIN